MFAYSVNLYYTIHKYYKIYSIPNVLKLWKAFYFEINVIS